MGAPGAAAAATSMASPPRVPTYIATLAGIPLADIPTVAGPESLEPRYVNHQLTVNGCLLAIRQACRAHPRAALQEWTADPHARVRYQVGRSWRTVHPDAIAETEVDGRCRWMYLEVDRGTAELRRYGLKLRRYARFYLSGSWRREYATFPEIRIVTAHRPRVRRMLAEVEDTVRSFSRTEHDALVANVVVAVDVGVGVPGGSGRGRLVMHLCRGLSRAAACQRRRQNRASARTRRSRGASRRRVEARRISEIERVSCAPRRAG